MDSIPTSFVNIKIAVEIIVAAKNPVGILALRKKVHANGKIFTDTLNSLIAKDLVDTKYYNGDGGKNRTVSLTNKGVEILDLWTIICLTIDENSHLKSLSSKEI